MTEDQLEQETLGWLADVGYGVVNAPTSRPMDHHLSAKTTAR